MPPFTFPLNADPALIQTAVANLPSSTAPLSGMDAESAYWAAIWRNSIADYQAYLAVFADSAPADQVERISQLLSLLQQPNPQCQAMAAPPPPPAVEAGPVCPDGFIPQDGFNGAYCVPLTPPPVLDCPPGFSTIVTDDGMGCSPWIPPPVLTCPPFFHVFGAPPYCAPDRPPPFCPPGFRPIRRDDALTCVRVGPLPPGCPVGAHPDWTGAGYACVPNPPPPPSNCGNGKSDWRDGRWTCVNPPAPGCPNGQVAKWVDGREVCGVIAFSGGQPHCPQTYVPAGQGGLCAPSRAPVRPPTGTPPKGPLAPIKCANGEVALPGKGCPNGPGNPTTPPLTGQCPTGLVKGANGGCEPLRIERPVIPVKPAPVVHTPPPVVRPIVPRVTPPRPAVVKPARPRCGGPGEPRCPR